MSNYLEGKIYRIVSNINPEKVYYGSTSKSLRTRLCNHLNHYKTYKRGYFHRVSSFDIFDDGDFIIELVEEYPCNNKYELRDRERYYIQNNICVNKNIPNRTQKEYYIDNIDKITEYRNNYYDTNQNDIKNYFKKLPQIVCECGGHYINRKNRHLTSVKHSQYLEQTN